jgi:hypothetical protein
VTIVEAVALLPFANEGRDEEKEERREKNIRKRRGVITSKRKNAFKLSYTSMCGMSKSIEDL